MKRVLLLLLSLIALVTFIPSVLAVHNSREFGNSVWLFKKLAAFPELVWLLAPNESYSIGKGSANNKSWSKGLTGTHSNEFEKTLTSLLCLDLINDGSKQSYKQFIEFQTRNVLTFTEFRKMHYILKKFNKTDSLLTINLLAKNLILRDLGKSSTFREFIVNKYNFSELDPHYFMRTLLKEKKEFCYEQLGITSEAIDILLDTDVLHFGHLTHLEGGPEILSSIKRSKLMVDDQLMDFRLMTDLLEIAGCNGHLNNQGSTVLDRDSYSMIFYTFRVLGMLKDYNEQEVMRNYILSKGKKWAISLNKQSAPVVIKIASMMRLGRENIKLVERVIAQLGTQDKNLVLYHLNPLISRNEKTPTYIPNFLNALFVAECKEVKKGHVTHALAKTLKIALPFLAKTLDKHRKSIYEVTLNDQYVLSFNQITKQISRGTRLDCNSNFNIIDGTVMLETSPARNGGNAPCVTERAESEKQTMKALFQ